LTKGGVGARNVPAPASSIPRRTIEMIGRRTIVGLSLLSVLAFCAFAAQGASAAWETATNTTAFTCVKGGGKKDFKNSGCSEPTTAGTGKFGHVEIPTGTSTDIESSSSESLVFTAELLGAKVTITCKKTVPDTEVTSFIENTSTGGTNMDLHGTTAVVFQECSQTGNGAKCTVPNITLKTKFHGAKEPTKANMAVEFEGDESENLFTIAFAGTCLIKEASLKGVLRGTVNGDLLEFKAEDEELTFFGNPATLTQKFTTKMTGGGNPISITTT
jgi:hypothetical protein